MEPKEQLSANHSGLKAVEDLVQKARLASWASDREALTRSAPDVVLGLGLADESKYNAKIWRSQNPGEYEQAMLRAIEAFWPLGCEPTSLPGMTPHRSIEDVFCRGSSIRNFTRRFDMHASEAALALEEVHEEVTSSQTWTDEDGNEHSDDETYTTVNQLILVTPRVALTVRSGKGFYGDDDYNAELEAALYICEKPASMQRMLRSLMNTSFYDRHSVWDADELEDKLKAVYGETYEPPEPRASIRP